MRSGDVLGDYLLGPLLGEGGSGAVFAASGPLDAPGAPPRLAVKVVPAARGAALRAEAAAQQAAACAQVLPVLDMVVDDGRVGLVTPLLPDGDLAAHVRAGGPLSPAAALALAGDVAAALAATHAAGLVHGDVAPGNVLLRRCGPRLVGLLADFGAAHRAGTVARGGVRATRHWAAPEVAAGATPDAASDVHALGAVLVLLLAGEPSGDAGCLPAALAPLVDLDPRRRPSAERACALLAAAGPGVGATPARARGWRIRRKK